MTNQKEESTLSLYSDFISVSFKDLVSFTNHDKEIFLDLYYNRDTEFNRMKSILKNIRNRGDNILIYGVAGSGKSSFMYKVFYEIEYLKDYNLYPIIVDFNKDSDINSLLKKFIKDMTMYFEAMECPINNLKDNTNDNIDQNLHLLKYFLSNCNRDELKKHLIILLDDFDFVEQNHLFRLLDDFKGIGVHPNATIVLSARPNLFAAINEYDNRLSKHYTRDVHQINLARLDLKKLISKRLAVILFENEKTNYWHSLVNKLLQKESPYLKLLNKMGINNFEALKKIELPFTGLYLNFITCITNHNIREMFDIVHDSIIYILEHGDVLEIIEEREDGEVVKKKEISKEATLKLFYDERPSAKFKIINIHKDKSKQGNSLFFNVLEGIKTFRELNPMFYSLMKKLGHSKEHVDWAINVKLKSPGYAMIAPSKIIPAHVTDRVDRYAEYVITDKGEYYLSIISYWEEYIQRCGSFGESIHKHYNM
jgi:predicted AAA+ superfamily ATPase/bifunctional DNA-binding transcriptional regulator/antitoxin component of YhaV-PrlF toxin-antitoxin module